MTYRVLLFGTEYPPSAAGTASYARSLAQGLTMAGAQVRVLTQGPASGILPGAEEGAGFDVTFIPHAASVPVRYLRCRKALQRELASFEPHCLWTTNGMGTRVAGLLRQIGPGHVPLISCTRGTDLRSRLPGRGLGRRVESIPQRRCYERSGAIAAACHDLKRIAISKGLPAERIVVSHSAFDLSRIDAHTSVDMAREPASILTVARLTRQKRVDVLIRALARLTETRPARLTIVGDGPERSALESLAREQGVGDHVHFTGSLPPRSPVLYDQYRRAGLFCLVSAGEGLANVFIEAGAFGLASVGSDDGGTPEVVQHGQTGLLVPPDDVDALAAALLRMIEEEGLAQRLGRQARAWIEEEFGIDTMGRRSLELVRCVIEGGRLPRMDALPDARADASPESLSESFQ